MSVAATPVHAAEKAATTDAKNVAQKKQDEKSTATSPWRVNAYFVFFVHFVSLLSLIFYRPKYQTVLMTLVIYATSALGITMGYHRLWSHRAFTASFPLRLTLAIFGTTAFQASIKWWVLRHRLHHRYTDTDHDPYNSQRGFYYSHIGWIFERPHYPKMRSIDITDLTDDPVVRFQHKYYIPLALTFGFIVPTLMASLWGDMLGGFLFGGYVARIMIWHSTFSINSFAHWTGEQFFATGVSARGNLLLALFTMGEGYHNFHHEFPKDYRNGVLWWHWDPTKWTIFACERLGLASYLYRAPADEIDKAQISVKEVKVRTERDLYNWGPQDDQLLRLTLADFQRATQEDETKQWILVDGFVLDTKNYRLDHPGGEKFFKMYRGKDASHAFNGGINLHTAAARSIAKMMRVGMIVENQKEE